ncbi:MAG TPA: N-acetylmuramoyl-L-alanine amidase [Actinomycetota bacterium]|nr:N-acetylmuramoyl-L-alanine amidase [Actinomycetota bacterium]
MDQIKPQTRCILCLVALATLSACFARAPSPRAQQSLKPSQPPSSTKEATPPPPSSPPPATPGIVAQSSPPPFSAPGVLTTGPAGAGLAGGPGNRVIGRLRAGIPVPYTAIQSGWARILTPCEQTRWIRVDEGINAVRPLVILDPGHGGDEQGAVGPSGLTEKSVNLDVASKAAELLAAQGVPVVLTRTGDYRATLGFRVALAGAVRPDLLVSIHHNADPDGRMERPGSETYYQFRSQDSKRLAGLMFEEAIRALSTLPADWVGDTDAGAKWRLNSRGEDYYGLLRRARDAGVTSILAELAFVSNPSEEALLAREDTRRLEADAVARAVIRYLRSKDPGSGFTTPYPRTEPAGPGGGRGGCVDPS